MMFPSADPFAYPNQPMTTTYSDDFDTKDFGIFQHTPTMDSGNSNNDTPNGDHMGGAVSHNGNSNGNGYIPPSSTFLPRHTSSSGDVDVQLFGPVPMYQMQGIKGTAPAFTDPFAGSGGHEPGPDGDQTGPMGENGVAGMNLDDLFGGEEWAGLNLGGEVGGLGQVGNMLNFR